MNLVRPICLPAIRQIADYGVALPDGFSGGTPAPPEPEEFITDGGFPSGDNWTISAGWTIGSGLATNTLAGGTRRLTQVFGPLTAALITSNDYVLSFDAGNATNVMLNAFAYIGAYDGSGQITGAEITVSTGPVSVPFTAGTDSTTLSLSLAVGQPTGMTIDNVSIVPAP